MGYFIFDNVRSDAYGIVVSGTGVFDGPERDVTIVTPAGAADLVLDNGRYKNTPIIYPCAVLSGLKNAAKNARAWLCSRADGYYRLEDSYNTDEYRLARFKGPLTFTAWAGLRGADFEVMFDAKPQRFLKSGEVKMHIVSGTSATVTNPTINPSKPLIHVAPTSNSATITINGAELRVNTAYAVDIDAEKRIVTRTTTGENYASHITGDFPILKAGDNTIAARGGDLQIVPRWYRL